MNPRNSERSPARRRGFTLLELIIATAVGAVVLVVIQTTFFSALRLHNTTHARVAEDQTVQRAVGIIRRDLAGIVLPGGTNGMARDLSTSAATLVLADNLGERITPDIYTSSGRIDGGPRLAICRPWPISWLLRSRAAAGATSCVR